MTAQGPDRTTVVKLRAARRSLQRLLARAAELEEGSQSISPEVWRGPGADAYRAVYQQRVVPSARAAQDHGEHQLAVLRKWEAEARGISVDLVDARVPDDEILDLETTHE